MALTHEEITAIKKEVIAECKNIFVQIDDCNDKQNKVNEKFANDDKRIDLILHKQEIGNNAIKKNNWLTTTILGIIIAGVIGYIFLNFGG
jgi:hypothetical protein